VTVCCGDPEALSEMTTVVVRLPEIVGAKATSKVQLAPGATPWQLWRALGMKKEEAFAPEGAIAVTVKNAVVLVFVSVNGAYAEVDPTSVLLKVKTVGVIETGIGIPMPVTETVVPDSTPLAE